MKKRTRPWAGWLVLLLAGLALRTEAASKYWNPPSGNSWNTAANWSPSGVPGSGDVAIFDGTTNNSDCTLDATVNVAGMVLTNGYGGTVTQGTTVAMALGASGWKQSAGTFAGGTNLITLNGSCLLSGGTFNAGNQIVKLVGDVSVARSWTNSGGTFNAGSSTVWVYPDSGGLTISGSQTFNNLTLNGVYFSHYGYLTIPTGTTVTVTGTLDLYDGAAANIGVIFLGTGTIAAQGNITASYMRPNNSYAGTVRLLINGPGDQAFTNAGARLMRVEVNKPGGTLSLAGTNVMAGDGTNPGYWTCTAGNINAGTSTTIFYGDNGGLTISGSHALNNVLFDSVYNTRGDTISLGAGTTLAVAGTLTLGNTNVVNNTKQPTLNGGAINAAGDVRISLNNNCGGTTPLRFVGAGTQRVSYAGTGANYFQLKTNSVDKSGGALTLATDLSLGSSGQILIWTNGAVDLSSNRLTIAGNITIHPGATTLGVTVADATKAGRLACNSAITNIANVGLVVKVAATEAQVQGQTYTILTNSAVLNQPFESVTWVGPWIGSVSYSGAGGKTVTLGNIRRSNRGTAVIFR
jgi:hypothetical protein